ncbi:MAG: hypothetical protein HKO53_05310 [Gemmatimonadetes bacterium]|nr:hypothetical protein [Gemmatimonadota bacterium]
MRRQRSILIALLTLSLAAFLGGCSENSPTAPVPTQTQNRVVSTDGALELSLSTERASYTEGQSIPITFSVRNTGSQSTTYRFNSTKQHDIRADEDDATVWRWAHGRSFGRAITSITLKPGESRTWTEIWDQTSDAGDEVETGTYELVGVLPASGGSIESDPLEVRIR